MHCLSSIFFQRVTSHLNLRRCFEALSGLLSCLSIILLDEQYSIKCVPGHNKFLKLTSKLYNLLNIAIEKYMFNIVIMQYRSYGLIFDERECRCRLTCFECNYRLNFYCLLSKNGTNSPGSYLEYCLSEFQLIKIKPVSFVQA